MNAEQSLKLFDMALAGNPEAIALSMLIRGMISKSDFEDFKETVAFCKRCESAEI